MSFCNDIESEVKMIFFALLLTCFICRTHITALIPIEYNYVYSQILCRDFRRNRRLEAAVCDAKNN